MIFDRLFGRRAKEKKIENLVLSVLKHDRVAVENLLRQKADPNGIWKENAQKDGGGEGMTPLYAATSFSQDDSVEMVNLLIKYGAEVNTLIYVDEDLCGRSHYHLPAVQLCAATPHQPKKFGSVLRFARRGRRHVLRAGPPPSGCARKNETVGGMGVWADG